MKKNRVILILAIILLLGSATLFIFPEISKTVAKDKAKKQAETFDKMIERVIEPDNNNKSNENANNYQEALEKGIINKEGYPIDPDTNEVLSDIPIVYRQDLERLYQDSIEYNDNLTKRQNMNIDFSEAALDLSKYGIWNGIYGYIFIPSLDLTLPIFLGSSDYNMTVGITHLMNTSLPIGGNDTNTVIAGHTGYIGRSFFDALPYLGTGDTVYVTNFWGTMTYQVISTKVIGATETNDLYIQKGKDLLTLLTCTNAGKNRYEVQCVRS